MADLFKEIIPSILKTKKDVLLTPEDEKSYVPFVVNKSLSFHLDCILLTNEMNLTPHLDRKLQYHFFITTIRSMSRPFNKWMKLEESEDLDVIKAFYSVSNAKAKEYLSILTRDQVTAIKEQMDKGGLGNDGTSKKRGKG